MRYIVYTQQSVNEQAIIGFANTEDEVKELVTEQARKTPEGNIQVCMVN